MIRVFENNSGTWFNGNYIMNLTQSAQPYTSKFALGSTVCRQVSIDIDNRGILGSVLGIDLYEDNGSDVQANWTPYLTDLIVDSMDTTNEDYTTYNLTDRMVELNTPLVYTVSDSVSDILSDICFRHGLTLASNVLDENDEIDLWMYHYEINWEDNLSEREFVSYVAEVNFGYAYIDNGYLYINRYTPDGRYGYVTDLISIDECSSFKLGSKHVFSKVYVELAAGTAYQGTDAKETIYLNPQNILLNADTVDDAISRIYSQTPTFTFWDVEIEKCPLVDTKPCGYIGITNQYGLSYWFLCSIDYKYNAQWLGGYRCQFDDKQQNQTQIVTTQDALRRIDIKVDRETGIISQHVNDLSENMGTLIEQTADGLLVQVRKDIDDNKDAFATRQTRVNISDDGVVISQNDEGAYSKFTADGMEIWIDDSKQAWATKDGFASQELIVGGPNDTEKWRIHMSNDGNTLTFLRSADPQ